MSERVGGGKETEKRALEGEMHWATGSLYADAHRTPWIIAGNTKPD